MNINHSKYYISAFLEAAKNTKFQHRWMPIQTWADVMNHYYWTHGSMAIDADKLLRVLCRTNWIMNAIESNGRIDDSLSLYKRKFRGKDSSRQVWCFYAAPKDEQPIQNGNNWYDDIDYAHDLLNIKITRSKPQLIFNEASKIPLVTKDEDVTIRLKKKRKRPQIQCKKTSMNQDSDELEPSSADMLSSLVSPDTSSNQNPFTNANASISLLEFYWESPEACLLFMATEDEESAKDAVENQFKSLRAAMSSPLGYLNIIECQGEEILDTDPSEILTQYQVWTITQKLQLLLCALQLALCEMPKVKNWDYVCSEAISHSKRFGICLTTSSRVLRNWYQNFRRNRKLIVNCTSKHNLPPFLQQNTDVCTKIVQYAKENLSQLSVEFLLEYLHDVVLPQMVKERHGIDKNNVSDEIYLAEEARVLNEYGLTHIDPTTVGRWMRKLGFVYEPRKKGYYVDGHEKPATVLYRKKFVTRYLQYERQAHRWIQISLHDTQQLEEQCILAKNSGYRYTDDEGNEMVEFHIDTCHVFEEKANNETEFGGWLSVRRRCALDFDKNFIKATSIRDN